VTYNDWCRYDKYLNMFVSASDSNEYSVGYDLFCSAATLLQQTKPTQFTKHQ